MWWLIGLCVLYGIIKVIITGGGNSGGGDPPGGGGGGRKMGLGTKMTIAGVGGYAIGKKIAKL